LSAHISKAEHIEDLPVAELLCAKIDSDGWSNAAKVYVAKADFPYVASPREPCQRVMRSLAMQPIYYPRNGPTIKLVGACKPITPSMSDLLAGAEQISPQSGEV